MMTAETAEDLGDRLGKTPFPRLLPLGRALSRVWGTYGAGKDRAGPSRATWAVRPVPGGCAGTVGDGPAILNR